MDNDFNPYAAPITDVSGSRPRTFDGSGVWRDGSILVMEKTAALPDRCLKCNDSADGYKLRKKLSWHRPAYYLLVLFNIIIYVIVAMIVRKTAKVEIPLCPEHRQKRIRLVIAAWTLCLLALFCLVVGFVLPGSMGGLGPDGHGIDGKGAPIPGFLFIGSVLLFFAGLICGLIASNVVSIDEIDKNFVRLKKVNRGFLTQLPHWPD